MPPFLVVTHQSGGGGTGGSADEAPSSSPPVANASTAGRRRPRHDHAPRLSASAISLTDVRHQLARLVEIRLNRSARASLLDALYLPIGLIFVFVALFAENLSSSHSVSPALVVAGIGSVAMLAPHIASRRCGSDKKLAFALLTSCLEVLTVVSLMYIAVTSTAFDDHDVEFVVYILALICSKALYSQSVCLLVISVASFDALGLRHCLVLVTLMTYGYISGLYKDLVASSSYVTPMSPLSDDGDSTGVPEVVLVEPPTSTESDSTTQQQSRLSVFMPHASALSCTTHNSSNVPESFNSILVAGSDQSSNMSPSEGRRKFSVSTGTGTSGPLHEVGSSTGSLAPVGGGDDMRSGSFCSTTTSASNSTAASRLRDVFVANVSDELRTPVSALQGLIELMKVDEHERNSTENWKTLTSIADSLLLHVDNLVDIAKVAVGDTRSLVGVSVPGDIESIVSRVVDNFNARMLPRQVHILPLIDLHMVGTGAVLIDRHRAQQALLNVLHEVHRSDLINTLLYLEAKPHSNNTKVQFVLKAEPLKELPPLDAFRRALATPPKPTNRMNVNVAIAVVRACGGEIELHGTEYMHLTMNCLTIIPEVESVSHIARAFLVAPSLQLSGTFLQYYLTQLGIPWSTVSDPRDIMAFSNCVTFMGASTYNEQPLPDSAVVLVAEQHTYGGLRPSFSTHQVRELVWPFYPQHLLDVLYALDTTAEADGGDSSKKPSMASISTVNSQPVIFTQDPLHIMLVEDNNVINRVTVRKLTLLFENVSSVSDGSEAVHRYCSHPEGTYNVILMDLEMPGLNGAEATRQIRAFEHAQSWTQKSFIIAVTANTTTIDREQCLECGMNDYLCKPLDVTSLVHILKKSQIS
eukprot:PhM_4_TR7110/c0_g1_i1/m.82584